MKTKTITIAGISFAASILFFAFFFSAFRSGYSKAAGGTIILQVKLQGEHFEPNTIKGHVAFYNNLTGKAKEMNDIIFVYKSDKYYYAAIPLDPTLPLSALYAISIKPKGYLSRLFCSETITGAACTVPQFKFANATKAFNLSTTAFSAGDVEPYSGNVDGYDLSNIIANLGKMGEELKGDVTGDGMVNVIDYAVAISSLSRNITDEIVPTSLSNPTTYPTTTPATPSATLSPSTSPTLNPTPSSNPTKTPTATPTISPTNNPTLIPTAIPTPTSIPTPTTPPKLGKNCSNGTEKITKSINKAWSLNVLPIPYAKPTYICIAPKHIVLHWSDSPTFLGNSATWGTLNAKNVVCGLAIDSQETLQMSNFYDDKITWEGCSPLEDSINIEINGTQFDLWYNNSCDIVNPTSNNALAAGELQKKKDIVAAEYGASPSTLDWENVKYISMMKNQEKRVLDAIRYLMTYYSIPVENITGHNKLAAKDDPGDRFLTCIKKKLE